MIEVQDRVRDHTPLHVNDKIDMQLVGRITRLSEAEPPEVARRIEALNHEWDVDRALMANFAILGGVSFLAGEFKNKRWHYLFGAQMGFLLLHSIIGWCPPCSVLRRLGFRTYKEICQERRILETLLEERVQ
jgi:hypothetical protein